MKSSWNFSHGFKRFITSERYVLSLAVLLTYGLLRQRNANRQMKDVLPFIDSITDFAGWERMAFILSATTGGIRFWKARSLDEGLISLLMHAQLFVLIMATTADKFALLLYLIAFGTIYLLFPLPSVTWAGQDEKLIEDMTPNQFNELVLGAGSSSDITYIVIFYASWHSGCRALVPMFTAMASRYSTDKIKFRKVDVGNFTHLARSKALDIEISPYSKQLPTTVLYEKGEEQLRVPRKMAGKVYGAACNANDIAKAFELDMRYARHAASQKTASSAVDKKDR